MKKETTPVLIAGFVLFSSILSLGRAEEKKADGDFRNARWGMTREEVKNTESLKIQFENEQILGYEDVVAGMKSGIAYIFTNNKLTRAKYIFAGHHTNNNDYILDYKKLKSLLEKKYGPPREDKTIWKKQDSYYKDDIDRWGMAVAMGELFFYSEWENEATGMFLGLLGDNLKIEFVLEYTSKKHEAEADRIEEERKMENL